jgi:hypothetical protein
MHWSAPTLAALPLLALPLSAVKMLSGSHVFDLRSAPPVLDGGSGNDRIQARDGTRDTVDGGGGRDTVTADRSDRVRHVERRR